ncbi:adenylate kinase [Thermogymnomonas acidicola]|uniref:Adenylate kinase n=1 Tax=Thermogymnomonas acidicola TaxID=399579 RepID=A0AA37BR49_9ARCH|nr:adenylate kinase [Thermogymnomonas acidicola]GGM72099.1 adenylate kinase [Thermogymnomonas acidicola]
MRVVIAGVAGVGKSTVLEIVAKRSKYEIVNFGTLMFEMAKDIGLVSNRDEIRKLPVDTQINLQKKASSAIGRMDDVIVDTHMSIKSKNGYLPGLPEWVLRELKIASYFLIEADPVLIKRRREMDPTRSRDDDTVEEIRTHQEVNRYFAVAYSIYTGATVNFIENPEGKPNIAAENILSKLV